jgi:anti-sigma B factor antagonist
VERQYAEAGTVEVSAGPVTEDAAVLCVVGEIDVLTAPTVSGAVERQLAERADGDTRPLVLDLSGVTFLASAGLAALANAKVLAAQHNVQLGVVASSRVVLRPLTLTGLDQALHVAPDVAGAIVRS